MPRPITTLFMIESLDGKISTGAVDALDVDKDFNRLSGVKEGLHQYYDLEKLTDPVSLNTGRVMAKIGVNARRSEPKPMNVSFVIIDNRPHLTEAGMSYLAKWVKHLYLVTTNPQHPAYAAQHTFANITILPFSDTVDLPTLLATLNETYGIDRLTIQSGGTLNAAWIRQELIDFVSVVIAPCLIGGSETQSLIGGPSLRSEPDLQLIKSLQLIACTQLAHSYLHVVYRVNQHTIVDPPGE